MSKYTPWEPMYKISLVECSKNELDAIVRTATAVIRGLNFKHLRFKEVKQIFEMPDHKAASRLGLTVTSQGLYKDHDLKGPHVWLLACAVGRTIATTIKEMKTLRDAAKARRAELETMISTKC
ncbi:hypothetical protein CR3_gp147 [Cronobacter phage CR3]|uniref:Uncharacterized protein n=1 Tax=Cronobacter phage CR3 TaxID=1162295 RepID=I1TRI9_9CAUD|nr:hypothetical protein CR3_gp147 [Cronobacter phage CR3]AFH21312.1 hypothetical protein CR3_147 [Cronobacter phage CR3]